MRQSTIELRTYTDPKHLEIAGAIATLPAIASKKANASQYLIDNLLDRLHLHSHQIPSTRVI